MLKKVYCAMLCLTMLLALLPVSSFGQVYKNSPSYTLKLEDWKIAPSATFGLTEGLPIAPANDTAAITPSYDTSDWCEAKAPGTVLGALVDAGKYDSLFIANNEGEKDVMFSDNITRIPEADFASPWWWTTDFTIPASEFGKKITLTFKGISYAAEVYVNGVKVDNTNLNIKNAQEVKNRRGDGSSTGLNSNPLPPYTYVDVTNNAPSGSPVAGISDFNDYSKMFVGTFRTYDIDVTNLVHVGDRPNNIKLKITRARQGANFVSTNTDFSHWWVDWHMMPADSNMGITGNCYLTTSGVVRLANPVAVSKVADDLSQANVTFSIDASNMTNQAVTGTLIGVVKDPSGYEIAKLSKEVTIRADQYNQEISLPTWAAMNPRLWWPNGSGEHPLYTIEYNFVIGSGISDSLTHRFGIREINTEINLYSTSANSYMMQIYVNHQPIVYKGGGYCPTDLLLRHSELDNVSAIELMKEMGFNGYRDEGKFFDEQLLDLMDENGIMLITGWCCCDRHQEPQSWSEAERFIVYEALYSQIRTHRSHASFCVWMNGSDNPPDYNNSENAFMVTRKLMEIEGRLQLYDVSIICASGGALNRFGLSQLTGATGGMQMEHSYDTMTPTFYYSHWNEDANPASSTALVRGTCGFISEGHGGGGIPTLESFKKMMPAANYWPMNTSENYNVWRFHSVRASFESVDQFLEYVDQAYGGSNSLEEWNIRAQLYNYDYQRAQYEALNWRRFVNAAGLINWMMSGPRPTIMWNQFDYYMNPHGGTFGAGKGNEPVHIMYNVYNKNVYVINSTPKNMGSMTATLTAYDINGIVINNPLVKTLDVLPDSIGGYSGDATSRVVGFIPSVTDGEDWYTNEMIPVTYDYNRRVTSASGVSSVWTSADIDASFTRPTSDVYFIRLELADAAGKVISYNNYTAPRRNDVDGVTSNWARGSTAQVFDLTQLNALPEVSLTLNSGTATKSADGKKITQTIDISNNTPYVAYGVEIKSYKDSGMKELIPATYDDNLLIIFPGQTRTVTVSHYAGYLDGPVVIGVNCYNNIIKNKPPIRNIYDTVYDRTGAQTTTSVTTNLARAKQVNGANSNATSIASVVLANNGTTVIDSNINSVATFNQTTPFYVDLGDGAKFDKIMVRWNAAFNVSGTPNYFAGVPDRVKVEYADSTSGPWTEVLFNGESGFDNTKARSIMTDIILPETVAARYVRFTPSGLAAAAPPYGSGVGMNRTSQRAAATNFNVAAIEVYKYRYAAYLDILSADTIGNIAVDGANYTRSMNALQRSVAVDFDSTLTFNPGAGNKILGVFKDNIPVTLTGSNNNQLMLSSLNADTDITAVYVPVNVNAYLVASSTNLVTRGLIKATAYVYNDSAANKKYNLIAAIYDSNGRLEQMDYVDSSAVASNASATFDIGIVMPNDVVGKSVKVFLWDAETYAPIVQNLIID